MSAADPRSQPSSEQPPERRGTYTLIKVTDLAALKSRIEELEGALQPIVEVLALEWRFKGAHPHREAMLQKALAALSHRSAKT